LARKRTVTQGITRSELAPSFVDAKNETRAVEHGNVRIDGVENPGKPIAIGRRWLPLLTNCFHNVSNL
jgi:hypothetical protein